MDFHQLLARMQELDRPATESQPVQADECGMPPPASSMSPAPTEPPIPHPSLSVNLNAQGMDNIEQIMRLITKVNPDAVPQQPPMPTMAPPPSIMSIKPELPPLKMLPDFDADNDDMPGGEKDMDHDMDEPKDIMVKMGDDGKDDEGSQPGGLAATLDRDGDGDHDMDDHEMEPKDDEEDKKEAWENEPDECEADIDYMNNKLAGGMNRPKDTFPKVAGGDNPMQRVREASDLKDQIKAELRRRLAEAKGAR